MFGVFPAFFAMQSQMTGLLSWPGISKSHCFFKARQGQDGYNIFYINILVYIK